MFRATQVMLLNKVGLLPHLQFDLERCLEAALEINPTLKILQVSATTGEGNEGVVRLGSTAAGKFAKSCFGSLLVRSSA